jgi:hypothetical protein
MDIEDELKKHKYCDPRVKARARQLLDPSRNTLSNEDCIDMNLLSCGLYQAVVDSPRETKELVWNAFRHGHYFDYNGERIRSNYYHFRRKVGMVFTVIRSWIAKGSKYSHN